MTRDDQPDQPDHTDDARDRDTGAGYPEEQPGGAQPGAQRGDERDRSGAPRVSSDEDGGPGQATGNPHAAG